MSVFRNAKLAQNSANIGDMYHGAVLDLANMSYAANMRDSAIGLGLIGGAVGAFSSDSSFISGATEGALWGVGKGVATKVAANHYATGAFKSGGASVIQENGRSIFALNGKNGFSVDNFSTGWKERSDIFGGSASAFK